VAMGGMYPGGLVGDWILATPGGELEHHEYRSQVDFSSAVIHEGSPETEFRQRPDKELDFKFFNSTMKFDDGGNFEIWTFESETSGRKFPAPLARVTEGQIFHGTVHPGKEVHTIHWHGVEPDPRNDGVGHTSFEVTGQYTYQWQPEPGRPGDPNVGAAGNYFYHCHVNTPLHVQLGMFGPLVIDPVAHPDFPVSPGARRAFVDGPEYDIDTEAILAPYAVDPRWNELGHAAGLSGEDVGLDKFEPSHFYLLGGELAHPQEEDGPRQLSRIRANVTSADRKPTLLRFVNATFIRVNAHFTDAAGKPVEMAELISHDGRPYRDTSSPTGACPPTCDTDSPLVTDVINVGAAERYDIILNPPSPGDYVLTVELMKWTSDTVIASRNIAIIAR
ncbi:multicopper oxidase domain-containing protein, partial [Arthrobacter cavernae]